MMADVSRHLDKAHEGKSVEELAGAPVDVLQDVSANDAEALKDALGIKTVRDLAGNKHVRRAQAIVHLADVK